MHTQTKLYVGLAFAAIIALGLLGGGLVADRKVKVLENVVTKLRLAAETAEQSSAAREIEAAEHRQKIDYLETKISEIKNIARRQDEELETLSIISRNARGDLERTRRIRSVAATADELCAKLAELGHAC